MPTGYTANIIDKEDYTFKDFAQQCARAFGACSHMRDAPMDAPLYARPEGSDNSAVKRYQRYLDNQNLEIEKLTEMSDPGREAYGSRKIAEGIKDSTENLERCRAENAKYEAMAAEVLIWSPPTEDHRGLKDFMLEQLKVSKSDMSSYYEKSIADYEAYPSGISYWNERLITARDIRQDYMDQLAEAKAKEADTSAVSSGDWIGQLIESLGYWYY